MNTISVDVIIPTYRPDDKFERLLKGLSEQSYPIAHIIVINTKAGEFPYDIQSRYPNIILKEIEASEFDHGATRDAAAHLSEAEVLVYMTQDAIPHNRDVITNLVQTFEEQNVGAAYARQLPASDCDVIERYTRSFNYPANGRLKRKEDLQTLGIKTYFCSNVCAAYRRTIFEEMGGFVHRAIFNEDMIMAGKMIQKGYAVAYAASAEVIHSHNYSCTQQFHRNFDIAVSQQEYPEIFEGIRSEGEGIRLVKQTMQYLIKIHKLYLIIPLVVRSGFKFMGYKLGQKYRILPHWLVLRCTMNPRYWIKK